MCLYPMISRCAPGKFSRTSWIAGRVRMKSPIAPPRMTRIRGFMPSGIAPKLLRPRHESAEPALALPLLRPVPRDRAHAIGVVLLLGGFAAAEQPRSREHQHKEKCAHLRGRSYWTGRPGAGAPPALPAPPAGTAPGLPAPWSPPAALSCGL